ncbi:ribosomal 5S rRNA E-loop binding protein Ctc/L25/TL5 [Thermodesulfatator indicus DSM 15286]|uniref:Large ribosomal subunit protein bL25 n=1 Tax=Thermodesulfatator indicus (strain DSM 15286 / JCM 11887 / CIR29812) TaxID=667014 RepID=F8AAH3_THEID|nr:50S ribosomal protein L25/general stress protein Ctc [Thermodesulfatator indicus]AEH45393.1 ribosomal 5S rRNA E-loop binding protein Ctc/L25/TL5 [Thermodesulfatator indicus DSM 15286]
MKTIELTATIRPKTGKEIARKLRAQGLVPGVIYGPETEPVPLAVKLNELKKYLYRYRDEQLIFNLTLENNGSTLKKIALVKDLQYHPVTDEILHVDFYEISMEREVEVEVPIELVGKAKGVETGGHLQQLLQTMTVACLPGLIPDKIEVDVSELDQGDVIHVKDLTPPEGVRYLDNPDEPVVTVLAPEEEKEEAEVEETAETETETSE